MASFAGSMSKLLEANPTVYKPLRILGVLSKFTLEAIYALLRHELREPPYAEWAASFFPDNDSIKRYKIDEMLDELYKAKLVRRDHQSNQSFELNDSFQLNKPLKMNDPLSVSAEVHQWVRDLPISERVKLAGQAIGTISQLIGHVDPQYLYPQMKSTWLYADLAPSSRDNIGFEDLDKWFNVFHIADDFELVDSISMVIFERYNQRKPEEKKERERFSSSGKLYRVLAMWGCYLWREDKYESAWLTLDEAVKEADILLASVQHNRLPYYLMFKYARESRRGINADISMLNDALTSMSL
ncbi:hypothetical protein N7447_003599 [Penicillium robsamsonii]|uniref:uncharacterized protein n=1 Tax=Penicillium robsamsonii TaxID=1792511 RepID=UPI002548600B|nr:uncharacterized protein N7447_003599 [Penicillium robsamsonii]KAJ5826836.1 hypothetical protein N7447_003599 [Penicillium robsamsonii]